MNPEDNMRQYFEADGSPRRLDAPIKSQRITETCQPVFPCWLYPSISYGWTRWQQWMMQPHDITGAGGYTHFHPDQPDAPTERPEDTLPKGGDSHGAPTRVHDTPALSSDPTERAASPQLPTPRVNSVDIATAAFKARAHKSMYRNLAIDLEAELAEARAEVKNWRGINDIAEAEVVRLRAEVERLELKVDHLNALTDAQSKDAAENLELRAQLAAAREDVGRVDRILAENKRLNALPGGNYYHPETREGFDSASQSQDK